MVSYDVISGSFNEIMICQKWHNPFAILSVIWHLNWSMALIITKSCFYCWISIVGKAFMIASPRKPFRNALCVERDWEKHVLFGSTAEAWMDLWGRNGSGSKPSLSDTQNHYYRCNCAAQPFMATESFGLGVVTKETDYTHATHFGKMISLFMNIFFLMRWLYMWLRKVITGLTSITSYSE